jgi:hypothetical protein
VEFGELSVVEFLVLKPFPSFPKVEDSPDDDRGENVGVDTTIGPVEHHVNEAAQDGETKL